MDSSEVNLEEELVPQLVSIDAIVGDLVTVGSVCVQGVQDLALGEKQVVRCYLCAFVVDDQDSS